MEALVRVLWIFLQLRISCSQDPQHVVTFAPNYYSFTSIGTNELPPEIAGTFSPSGQLTQAVTPSSAEFSPSQFQDQNSFQPTTFQEINLPPNNQQLEIVPILPPNNNNVEPDYQDYPNYDNEYPDYQQAEYPDYQQQQPEYPDYQQQPDYPDYQQQQPDYPDYQQQQPDYPDYQQQQPDYPDYQEEERRPDFEYQQQPEYPQYEGEYPEDNVDIGFEEEPINGFQPLQVIPETDLISNTESSNLLDQTSEPSYYQPSYDYYQPPEEPLIELLDNLPAETSLTDPNLQCYERTCDQNITGSDMSYERALEIIQTEEYLTAADVDLIAKKKRRKKRFISFTKVRCSNGFNVFNKVNCPRFDFDLSNIFPFSLIFRGPIRGPFGRPSRPTRRPRFRFRPPPPIVTQTVLVDPPIIPINVAQPGEPGGGALPDANPSAAALAPPGRRAVTVFPPYLFPRTVPAVCVIYLDTPKPKYPKHEYGYGYHEGNHPKPVRKPPIPFTTRVKNYFRSLKYRHRRHRVAKRDTGYGYKTTKKPRIHLQEVIAYERTYGFRCTITLVDRQSCQLGVSCDSEGNRLAEKKKRQKRQAGEEFIADGPPECRTELSPLGCTPLRKAKKL